MASVLLVNPPIYDFAAFDLWARPLGLLYIAAALEEYSHEVRIVDCLDRLHPDTAGLKGKNAPKKRRFGTGHYYRREAPRPAVLAHVPRIYRRFGLPAETIEREMRAGFTPDLVGVTSAMTYWYPGVVEAARIARRVFPRVPIALGGIYATLCPEHARESVNPDFLVAGPGEAEMVRIAAEIGGGQAPSGEIAFDRLPPPAYHLLGPLESAAVLTGRGCPFRCAYCAVALLAPEMERIAPEAAVDGMERIVSETGVKDVAFFDDALLWDAENHAKPMLRGIIERGLAVRFHTPNGLHARFVDGEVARLMRRAGFATIRLSLETLQPALAAKWDGKVRYDEFLDAAGNLRAAGFGSDDLGAYVMIGSPGETAEDAAKSIAAAHAAGVRVRLAQYSPVPGTELFDQARRASGMDLSEPLLHNNTAIPAGALGWAAYRRLKDFARDLNRRLAEGRQVFSPGDITEGRFDFAGVAGLEV